MAINDRPNDLVGSQEPTLPTSCQEMTGEMKPFFRREAYADGLFHLVDRPQVLNPSLSM